MKIGMVGLGKLGLPCLLAMENQGNHDVYGYDKSPNVIKAISERTVTYWEDGVNELLAKSQIEVVQDVTDLVQICDIIFVAVQTPHDPEFEGRTLVPNSRKDFDYTHLINSAHALSEGLKIHPNANPLIVVISTVLPGTMNSSILPILQESRSSVRFAYNPYFIAMGTTIKDFLNPEFFLIGSSSDDDAAALEEFYRFIDAPVKKMKIESAELTKVAYNTFIGFKIVFANALAEIVDERGGNVDEVTSALAEANYRIMSGTYLSAGMGDGGGCHPRDQIAMSWLAKELDLSTDIFEFLAKARDAQTTRQADLIIKHCESKNLSPVLLGISYKPNSPLDIGSPARLLEEILKEKKFNPLIYDPWIYPEIPLPIDAPYVYFVSSRHEEFKDLSAIKSSVIIDPWGHVEKVGANTELLTPGRSQGRI